MLGGFGALVFSFFHSHRLACSSYIWKKIPWTDTKFAHYLLALKTSVFPLLLVVKCFNLIINTCKKEKVLYLQLSKCSIVYLTFSLALHYKLWALWALPWNNMLNSNFQIISCYASISVIFNKIVKPDVCKLWSWIRTKTQPTWTYLVITTRVAIDDWEEY